MSAASTELFRPTAKSAAPSLHTVRVFTTAPNVPSAPALVSPKPAHLTADKCNCERVATNLTRVWHHGNGGASGAIVHDTLRKKQEMADLRAWGYPSQGNGM